MVRLTVALITPGRLSPETVACLVNLARLRDKAANDWCESHDALLLYLQTNKPSRPTNIDVTAWHHLIDATDEFEDAIDATHRALGFAAALKEHHGSELPNLVWPGSRRTRRISTIRNQLQHRESEITKGRHPVGTPFTLQLENDRAVVGSRSLSYSDLAGAIREVTAVSVELVKLI